jgi:hypothetical protein
VVQPEGRVGGRCVHILHDGADTVVTPSVGTTFSTGGHIGVGATRVAGIDHGVASVDGLGVVVVTGKAMALVAGSGADVDSQVSELLVYVSLALVELRDYTYTIRHTLAANVDTSEPLRAEDGGLGETASIARLVEPGQVAVEATVGAEHLLVRPQEVPVPQEELGVSVDVGCELLVEGDKVLVSAPGSRELARGGATLKALDGVDVCLAVAVGVRVPLSADAGVGASALPLLELVELVIQIAEAQLQGHVDGREDEVGQQVLDFLNVVLDGGHSGVDTRQGLLEAEGTGELGRFEAGNGQKGSGCAGSGGILGQRSGGAGDSQNG